MGSLDFATCIEAITFLEKRLGAGTGYHVLDPFSLDSTDTIAINKAAHRIAEFIGLGEYTFVVAVKSQVEGVGGNIELRHGEPGAFIEVDEDAVKFKDAVLATLSHEVCHKFLHIRNISVTTELKSQLDDEILTDLTGIFLGLGKLMLLGCECKKVTVQQREQRKVTTTDTYRCGYLNRSQLTLAYLVVCAMRRIPPRVYEGGLTLEVLEVLAECRKANSPFLSSGWYERIEKSGGLTTPESLAKTVSGLQDHLAETSRDLIFLQSFFGNVDSFSEQVHTRLYQLKQWLEDAQQLAGNDPCLTYLDSVRRVRHAGPLAEELTGLASKARNYQEAMREVSVLINSMVPALMISVL